MTVREAALQRDLSVMESMHLRAREEQRIMEDTLTRAQAESTRLVEEVRVLRGIISKLVEIGYR